MEIKNKDVLLHQNGTVYTVKRQEKSPYGGVKNVVLFNTKTQQEEKFDPKIFDQYFTKVDKELGADMLDLQQVGPGDYDSLKAVRHEYSVYLEQCSGKPPKFDAPYTNEEIKTIIEIDNILALYQLAMELQRTVGGLRLVRKMAAVDPFQFRKEELEERTYKGVPGDKLQWQIQTVLKDMGRPYSSVLDSRPDLEVHT